MGQAKLRTTRLKKQRATLGEEHNCFTDDQSGVAHTTNKKRDSNGSKELRCYKRQDLKSPPITALRELLVHFDGGLGL